MNFSVKPIVLWGNRRRGHNWRRRLGKLILRKTRRMMACMAWSPIVGILILIWSPTHFVVAAMITITPLALHILLFSRWSTSCQCSRGSINSLGWRQIIGGGCLWLFEMPKIHMGIQISLWQICPSTTIGTIPRSICTLLLVRQFLIWEKYNHIAGMWRQILKILA